MLYTSWDDQQTSIIRSLKILLYDRKTRRILVFLVLNLIFALVEIIYGWIANSLGLMGDGYHMIFDSSVIIASLVVKVVSEWNPTSQFTFGYGRAQVLISFINALLLCYASVLLIIEALERVMNPQDIHSDRLVLVSVVGLLINLVGVFAFESHAHDHEESHAFPVDSYDEESLKEVSRRSSMVTGLNNWSERNSESLASRKSSSSHSGSESHRITKTVDERLSIVSETPLVNFHETPQKRIRSAGTTRQPPHEESHSSYETNNHHRHDSEKHHHHHQCHSHSHHHHHHHHPHSHNNLLFHGMFLHIMADTLGSVMVIVSSLVIQFTNFTIIDPICSIILSLYILSSAFPLLKSSVLILMNAAPRNIHERLPFVLFQLTQMDGIMSYSDAHFWELLDGYSVGSIKIQGKKVDLGKVRQYLSSELSLSHLTIEIDSFVE